MDFFQLRTPVFKGLVTASRGPVQTFRTSFEPVLFVYFSEKGQEPLLRNAVGGCCGGAKIKQKPHCG